jgi:protein-disulfide isomerase/uncharacterized membrane protein
MIPTTPSLSLYRDSSFTVKIMLGILAAIMVLLSIYLTQHYFQVKFPTEIGQGSLCDFSSFLNCDAATHSHASNIFGVPISVFGMMIGLFLFAGFIIPDERVEGTLFSLLALNLIGCVALFIYSLAALGSLCPFCTLYYLASAGAFFLFARFSKIRRPHLVPLGTAGVLTLIVSAVFYYNVQGRVQLNSTLAKDLIRQYDNLPVVGHPSVPSPFRLASATEAFEDAPLRITVFSDYQCPACRMLSDMTHDMARRYRGKINIEYMFFPLDHNCNPEITRPMNPFSCQGAYLSVCLPDKFDKVHDDIFANQSNLSMDWIRSYARREGVLECLAKEETKQEVMRIVAQAKDFSVNSTPSMLVNGVKIVGVLPPNQLYIILDELLKRAEK